MRQTPFVFHHGLDLLRVIQGRLRQNPLADFEFDELATDHLALTADQPKFIGKEDRRPNHQRQTGLLLVVFKDNDEVTLGFFGFLGSAVLQYTTRDLNLRRLGANVLAVELANAKNGDQQTNALDDKTLGEKASLGQRGHGS